MKHNTCGCLLMIAGLLLLAGAAGLAGWNLMQSHQAEQASNEALEQLLLVIPKPETTEVTFAETPGVAEPEPTMGPVATQQPLFVRNPNMEMPIQHIDGRDYIGVLEIPSKGLELPVISEWSYEKLRKAPCRYAGSVYSHDIVIAGHNYPRHFSQIKSLAVGDEVRFTDVDGNLFLYKVSEIETLGKRDVSEMKTGDWDLTMFTCTYNGKKRATVRCTMASFVPAETE